MKVFLFLGLCVLVVGMASEAAAQLNWAVAGPAIASEADHRAGAYRGYEAVPGAGVGSANEAGIYRGAPRTARMSQTDPGVGNRWVLSRNFNYRRWTGCRARRLTQSDRIDCYSFAHALNHQGRQPWEAFMVFKRLCDLGHPTACSNAVLTAIIGSRRAPPWSEVIPQIPVVRARALNECRRSGAVNVVRAMACHASMRAYDVGLGGTPASPALARGLARRTCQALNFRYRAEFARSIELGCRSVSR